MRKLLGFVVILFILCFTGIPAKKREPSPSVKSIKVHGQIFKIFVHKYVNMFVFFGPDGAMLIDSGFEPVNLIRDELKKLGIKKIRFIINTHSNGDHLLGNASLGKDALIISHSKCREKMLKREGFPLEGLPGMVFNDRMTLDFNGEEIQLIHMPGHTDNDIVVHFDKSKLVFIGDLVFSDSFPGTQGVNGGNVFDLEKTLRGLTEMFPDDVTFLVGHGRDYSIKDMQEYHEMTRKTIAAVTSLIEDGLTLDQIKARQPLKEWESWDSKFFPGEITTDTWIENIHESYEHNQKSKPMNKPYLGQNPPGSVPEVFAPGIISHGFHELGISISPKGDEIFYITSDREYRQYQIIWLRRAGCRWMPPEVAPFSGYHTDNSLCFSADGNRLFFRSKRPPHPGAKNKNDGNFWVVEKEDDRWSHPELLKGQINSEKNELSLSAAANGSIYFAAKYQPEHGGDIYCSILKDGKYGLPKKIEGGISTEYGEGRPYISPDESFLLFQSNRPGSLGQNDLYVSFKKKDGTWKEPVNLGKPVNSRASEFAPHVSPDGKFLFFSSYRSLDPAVFKGKTYNEMLKLYRDPRNGYATIYWVDAEFIKNLKQKRIIQ